MQDTITFPLLNIAITLFRIVGALLIVWGGARTVYYIILPGAYPKNGLKKASLEEILRVELGQKIVFGLEFLVAGDIFATLKDPVLNELYRLGLLVVIRTLLSFFVGKEVKNLDIHQHQIEQELSRQNKTVNDKTQ